MKYSLKRNLLSLLASSALLALVCNSPLVAQTDSPAPDADSVQVAEPLQTLAPPINFTAADHIYDNGDGIKLTWDKSPADTVGDPEFTIYVLYRQDSSGKFDSLTSLLPGVVSYTDKGLTDGASYTYAITSLGFSTDGFSAESAQIESQPVTPSAEWFNVDLVWEFVMLWLLTLSVMYFIYSAKKGNKLFLRKIAGLEAVEEAIGRATEMGRPILFIPGIHDMDDVQTIAGMTILSKVSRQTADYDSRIIVPTRASLAMTAARETVREAYITAGRVDAYQQDDIFYVTDEQFGYVAAVNGIMTRDKPATCFYMGAFFAESLILAETGNSIGAIQIAGTAMPAQLPFFVAACDYTLIGEELFAASAYLSGDPKQMGSLKGQDVGKVVAMAAILSGVILGTISSEDGLQVSSLSGVFDWLLGVFTTGGS